ncbi:unnamed protein product [Spirodela intermedia]|uniref:Uncharacterized protein n=1 Tax=Spirodela intermedia TaxID=51605 RepID=A0A7I8IXR9_SPIIN|nr:unnamed protein product [Spirodela intermedia]CAA6662492.1 unnamed protein product [Spirodela intermedia]
MAVALSELLRPLGLPRRRRRISPPPCSARGALHSCAGAGGKRNLRRGDRSGFRVSLRTRASPPSPTPVSPDLKETRFGRVLSRSCKAGKYDEALYFLEYLVSRGGKPEVVLCTKLIKGFFNLRNVGKAVRVMSLLEAHGEPDVYSYNALISGFCKADLIDSAVEALDRMRRRRLSPDVVTYNIIIGSLCSKGRGRGGGEEEDDHHHHRRRRPTVVTYTILIEATIREAGVDPAMELLEEMAAEGLKPDGHTYNVIIRGICKEGLVDRARDFVRSLPDRGFEPDAVSYNILLRGMLNQKRGLKPNVVTYSILINALCQEGMADRALEALKEMMRQGLKPDTYSYDPLIAAFCREGRLSAAIDFMEFMVANGCLPDIINFNTVLSALCKKGSPDQAAAILEKLRETGCCSPNASSYNVVIGGLWSGGDRAGALAMVTGMMENGVEPDEVTFNVLISCLCRDGMAEEAAGFMREMKNSGGFKPTSITYNTVLLGFCKAHRIDMAIDIFAEMVEAGCRPNESTYVILVEGIAYAGRRAEAMELASELAARKVITDESLKRFSRTIHGGRRRRLRFLLLLLWVMGSSV